MEGPHLEAGDVALRSDDEPVVAWGGGLVEIATRNAGAWTIEPVTAEAGNYWSVEMELDSADRPVVAWLDHAARELRLSRFDGAAWNEELVPLPSPADWWCSLALDSADRPWIAYRDGENRSLGLARHDGTQWLFETVADTGDTGTWPSLVLDAADHPLIAYRDEAARSLELSRFDGSAWSHETLDPGLADAGRNTNLALVGGDPVISYARNDPDSLSVMRWQGFWLREPLAGGFGREAAMGTGADGSVHVASLGRRWWRHDGAAWSGGSAAESMGARIAALSVDSLGRPWVLGFDHDERLDRNTPDSGAILVSWRDVDGTWAHEIVRDGDDHERQSVTLSVDSAGRPALAWLLRSNTRMSAQASHWFGERAGGAWSVEEVAGPAELRGWHSLAHDLEDRPVAAFSESTPLRGLHLARREAGAWTRQQLESSFACCSIALTFDGAGTAVTAYTFVSFLGATLVDDMGANLEIVDSGRDSGERVSAATLPDGRPALAFQNVTQSWTYAERLGPDSWMVEPIDALASSGTYPSIAVGPGGEVWSSASRSEDTNEWTLRVARREGGAWTVEEFDRVFSPNRIYSSIGVLPDGQPVVAWIDKNFLLVSRRASDGSWSRTEIPVGKISHDHALRVDAAGNLSLAHDADGTVRLATWAAPVRLHRGVVASLAPGWRDAALPLSPDNDDETPPFPVGVEVGGTTPDVAPPDAPLVLYRVLSEGGAPLASVSLRVTKDPAGDGLLIAH